VSPFERDHVGEDLFERAHRRPTRELAETRRIRYPSLHVLEAPLVGLVVRDVDDSRARSGHADHGIRQVVDRDLGLGSDVEDPADRIGMIDHVDERVDHIGDVAEAASLGAVAVHGEVLVAERLAYETGDDHAELAGLARADGVE
jgi:hypothetical protein